MVGQFLQPNETLVQVSVRNNAFFATTLLKEAMHIIVILQMDNSASYGDGVQRVLCRNRSLALPRL